MIVSARALALRQLYRDWEEPRGLTLLAISRLENGMADAADAVDQRRLEPERIGQDVEWQRPSDVQPPEEQA